MSELAKELKPHFPQEAIQSVKAEINKLKEAVKWAKNYRNGLNPDIPKWGKPWRNELGK